MAFRPGPEEQSKLHRSWHSHTGECHWPRVKGAQQLSPTCPCCPSSSSILPGEPFAVRCAQETGSCSQGNSWCTMQSPSPEAPLEQAKNIWGCFCQRIWLRAAEKGSWPRPGWELLPLSFRMILCPMLWGQPAPLWGCGLPPQEGPVLGDDDRLSCAAAGGLPVLMR